MAPADRPRKPILGRSRDPTGGHYDPSARSFAGLRLLKVSDAARRDKAMSRTGAAERGKPSGNQEARTRDPKSPPWRAERRSASRKGCAYLRLVAPIGAPSPRLCEGSEIEGGLAGASNNTAGGALAV